MPSRAQIRRERDAVLATMPAGTQVRFKKDESVYTVGVPFGTNDVWLMSIEKGKKGLVSKWTLAREFEVLA